MTCSIVQSAHDTITYSHLTDSRIWWRLHSKCWTWRRQWTAGGFTNRWLKTQWEHKKKLKSSVKFLIKTHIRTTGCRLPYGITQCCLPPDTWTHHALTPAGEGWYSIYQSRRDGRLSWPRCLIMPGPGIKPMTAKSKARRPNRCATETPELHRILRKHLLHISVHYNTRHNFNIRKHTCLHR